MNIPVLLHHYGAQNQFKKITKKRNPKRKKKHIHVNYELKRKMKF